MFYAHFVSFHFYICEPKRAPCFTVTLKKKWKVLLFSAVVLPSLLCKSPLHISHTDLFLFFASTKYSSLGFYNAAEKRKRYILVFTALCWNFFKVWKMHGFEIWHLKKEMAFVVALNNIFNCITILFHNQRHFWSFLLWLFWIRYHSLRTMA